jgi:hypothetical protein
VREEVAQQEAELEALKNAEALKDEWERKARECAEEVCVCTHKRRGVCIGMSGRGRLASVLKRCVCVHTRDMCGYKRRGVCVRMSGRERLVSVLNMYLYTHCGDLCISVGV